MTEYELIRQELRQALEYSWIDGRLKPEKLLYYQLNKAVDKRYSFKIIVNDFNLAVIKYRGYTWKIQDLMIKQISNIA